MTRRVITAREQHAMLSPWRTAASPDIQQIIDSYRQTPRAQCRSTPDRAAGWCEDSMEDFINYARDNGVDDVSRREFNYPLRSSYPEPHKSLMWSPRSDDEEENNMWDGFHYAPVVSIKGVPHVVDWTARQLNHKADFPHVEPLDSYGANFGYHVDYEPPHPYGPTVASGVPNAPH